MSARKPDGQRVRRGEPDIPWTDIEPGPRKGRAPKPPGWAGLGVAGRAWWAWAWKLPVAKVWGEEDHPTAARRAELEDAWQSSRDSRVLAEMRHCETALGMTAKARKDLRWRFVDGAGVVERDRPEPLDDLASRRFKRSA